MTSVTPADREAITAAIKRAVSLLDVAQEATGGKMRRAGAEWRGPCPIHGNSDSGPNFAVNPSKHDGVYHCHVCGADGDVFALWMALRSCSFVEARRELAARAGIALEGEAAPAVHPHGYQLPAVLRAPSAEPSDVAPGPRTWSARTSADRMDAAAEWRRRTLAEGATWREPRDVYTALRDALSLSPTATRYLVGRGIEPTLAYSLGVRSVDDWPALGALLDALDVCPWEQVGAGFHLAPRYVLPDEREETAAPRSIRPAYARANLAALAFFYTDARGDAAGLRLRTIATDEQLEAAGLTPAGEWRYRSLIAGNPLPWGADALHGLAGHDLHVTEGEPDALTLRHYGVRSIGIPGATSIPGGADARWLVAAGKARRILAWYDADRGGDKGAPKLAEALQRANGWTDAETRRRVIRVRVSVAETGGKADPNTLHQAGALRGVLTDVLAA